MLRAAHVTLLLMVTMTAIQTNVSKSQAVTVSFTDSNQLNLTDRDVLSAVNFYDSTQVTLGSSQQMTGTIQGIPFLNLDHQTQTVAGALTVSFPHPGDGRAQINVNSTITGSGLDQPSAVQLATALTYWGLNDSGSLSYAFGPGYANRLVQVQLIGGDEGWHGLMDVKVGGVSQGTMLGDDNNSTANLLTFDTLTDGSGNLVLDITVTATNFYGLAGAIVTTAVPPAPEPSSLVLLSAGALLMARRRRSANKTSALV